MQMGNMDLSLLSERAYTAELRVVLRLGEAHTHMEELRMYSLAPICEGYVYVPHSFVSLRLADRWLLLRLRCRVVRLGRGGFCWGRWPRARSGPCWLRVLGLFPLFF